MRLYLYLDLQGGKIPIKFIPSKIRRRESTAPPPAPASPPPSVSPMPDAGSQSTISAQAMVPLTSTVVSTVITTLGALAMARRCVGTRETEPAAPPAAARELPSTPTKQRAAMAPPMAALSSSPPASPADEPLSTQFERPTVDRPLVCCIDGAIGAGKTTLIELVRAGLCARGHNAVVVAEPVEEWKRVGILQEFYEHASSPEPGLVAYDFQTYTFVTRVEECVRMVEQHPEATIFLLERSVLTDRFVFMELQRDLVGPRRMEMYEKWWAMWHRIMPWEPSKMVYLKPTLDKCMQRVFKRAREGEVKEEEKAEEAEEQEAEDEDDSGGAGVLGAYQARLCRAHDCYLLGQHADEFPLMPARPFKLGEDNVTVVEGPLADDDFSEPGAAQERVVAHICDSILRC
jgi:deoxyadenosine/deoxycytidine kinase